MDARGGQLLFLISQPRSGSTLLQHILASHSEVHTLPEPWFMLPLVYARRSSGCEAEFNSTLAYRAMSGFLEQLPGGEDVYWQATRESALRLYGAALETSEKKYYLDKTTRYYFIIPELLSLFPAAKIILLIRNPLAVLSSIIEQHCRGNLQRLQETDRRHDLLTGPRLILEGISQAGERGAVVRYEQLVADPEATVQALCKRISLAFEPGMLEYGDKVKFEGTKWVDQKSIYKHTHAVTAYADAWKAKLDTAQKIEVAQGYLESLGKDVVEALGYAYDDLASALQKMRKARRGIVVPWKLLTTPRAELGWLDRLKLSGLRLAERCRSPK